VIAIALRKNFELTRILTLDYFFLLVLKERYGNKESERNAMEEAISVYLESVFSRLNMRCFCGKMDSMRKHEDNGRKKPRTE